MKFSKIKTLLQVAVGWIGQISFDFLSIVFPAKKSYSLLLNKEQTGGKTSGPKLVFEVECCASFLPDGNSPVGFSFAGCFRLIKQFSPRQTLTSMRISGFQHLLAKLTSM